MRITHLVGCSGGCWRCREGETPEPETHNPHWMSPHASCHLLTRWAASATRSARWKRQVSVSGRLPWRVDPRKTVAHAIKARTVTWTRPAVSSVRPWEMPAADSDPRLLTSLAGLPRAEPRSRRRNDYCYFVAARWRDGRRLSVIEEKGGRFSTTSARRIHRASGPIRPALVHCLRRRAGRLRSRLRSGADPLPWRGRGV